MNFNTPPNWPPAPAGWTPPPGWSPDPAWGPAPDGWQFWVDDAGSTEHEPPTEPIDTAAFGPAPEEHPATGRSARGIGPALAGSWSRLTTSFRRERSADGAEPSDGQHTSRRPRRITLAVAAVALFGAGAGVGAAASDPTSSDEYAALASAKAGTEAEYAALQDDHETLQDDYDEMSAGLEDREAEFEEREQAVKASEGALKERERKVKDAEGAVKKREEAVSGAEQKKAENTIREGTWTVGVDIAPGTYRSTADVGSRCYWAILTTGTNGDDIIANDIPGGGRPTVTLAQGQDFETARCGTWQLQ